MVRRCVQKNTGLEFAAKIINTKKLSARGKIIQLFLGETDLDKVRCYDMCAVELQSQLSDPFFH